MKWEKSQFIYFSPAALSEWWIEKLLSFTIFLFFGQPTVLPRACPRYKFVSFILIHWAMVKSFPFSDIRVTVRTSTVAGCSYCIKLSFENWILDIFPWMVNFQAFHLVVQFNLKVSHWWYGITNHYEYIVMRMYGISFWCSESHKIKLFHYWICCGAFMYVHKIRWLNAHIHIYANISAFSNVQGTKGFRWVHHQDYNVWKMFLKNPFFMSRVKIQRDFHYFACMLVVRVTLLTGKLIINVIDISGSHKTMVDGDDDDCMEIVLLFYIPLLITTWKWQYGGHAGRDCKVHFITRENTECEFKSFPEEMEELSHSPAFPYTDWHDVE